MATTWRINNSTALGGEVCSPWQPNHAYSLGARCVCRIAYSSAARPFVFEVTTAGNSHAATEPTWPTTPGNTVADGPDTLVWTCRSPVTWDNASCYLWYLATYATIADGDSFYLHYEHNEAPVITGDFRARGSATINKFNYYLSVDKADDSLRAGAVVTLEADQTLYFNDRGYDYGIIWHTHGHVGHERYGANQEVWIHDNSTIRLAGNRRFYIGTTFLVSVYVGMKNFILYAEDANDNINFQGEGLLEWVGGSITAPNGITGLFSSQPACTVLARIQDVDLSAVGTGSLADVNTDHRLDLLFERCKLSATGTYVVNSWKIEQQGRIRFHHCSSGNNTYDFHEDLPEGTIDDETTIIRTGGFSHGGATPLSCKMISSAKVLDNYNGLKSPPIAGLCSEAAEHTYTIEGIYDSLTNLQNDEVWMELEYPANGTDGLGAVASDKCVLLAAPADKTASTVAWTTTGITNVNKFKCAVTVTPGKVGPVTARIYLAKASTTIYIDPKITET